jgi:hypothetical protein
VAVELTQAVAVLVVCALVRYLSSRAYPTQSRLALVVQAALDLLTTPLKVQILFLVLLPLQAVALEIYLTHHYLQKIQAVAVAPVE